MLDEVKVLSAHERPSGLMAPLRWLPRSRAPLASAPEALVSPASAAGTPDRQ